MIAPTFKRIALLLLVLGAFAGRGASANEEGVVDKAGSGIKKGGEAAGRGIEKGAAATEKGVKKAGEWVGQSLNKAGKKIEKVFK